MRNNDLLEDSISDNDKSKINQVALADREIFSDLVKIGELDPTVDLQYADLRGVDFSHSDLRGYNFSGADLTGSVGTCVTWDDTTIIEGALCSGSLFEYNAWLKKQIAAHPLAEREYMRYANADSYEKASWIHNVAESSGNDAVASKIAAMRLFSDERDLTVRNSFIYSSRKFFPGAKEYQSFLKDLMSRTDPSDKTFKICLSILAGAYYTDPATQELLLIVLMHGDSELKIKALRGLAHAINGAGVRQRVNEVLSSDPLLQFRMKMIRRSSYKSEVEKYRWIMSESFQRSCEARGLSPIDFDMCKIYSDENVLDTLVGMMFNHSGKTKASAFLNAYTSRRVRVVSKIMEGLVDDFGFGEDYFFREGVDGVTAEQLKKMFILLDAFLANVYSQSGICLSFSGKFRNVVSRSVVRVNREKAAEQDSGLFFIFSRITPIREVFLDS